MVTRMPFFEVKSLITECEINYSTVTAEEDSLVSVIIVCGGSSSRMNGIDKMFAEVGGMPISSLTVSAFQKCDFVDNIIIVTKDDSVLKMQQMCEKYKFSKVSDIVEGGNCRQRSVANGLDRVADVGIVLVHDGARPFVSEACILRVIDAAKKYGAATCAVKLKDTVKQITNDGLVVSTPDRESLVSVQTPQGFNTELYKLAVNNAQFDLEKYTDDCSVVEASGHEVYTVEGDYKNIKITTAEDLLYAEVLAGKGQV